MFMFVLVFSKMVIYTEPIRENTLIIQVVSHICMYVYMIFYIFLRVCGHCVKIPSNL